MEVPQNGWFIREKPIKMDALGVPPFMETPIYYHEIQWCINYDFTSNDPHQLTITDIYSEILLDISSVILSDMYSGIFWHFVEHVKGCIFLHFVWHSMWHSIWHVLDIYSDIVSDILGYITSLTFDLTFILTFYLTCIYIYIHTYIALRCIALHYITLHCITLHYITYIYIHVCVQFLLVTTWIFLQRSGSGISAQCRWRS
jgi:hypothetical protein